MYPKLINSSLRKAEEPYLYNFITDELYTLDEDALELLSYCTGRYKLTELQDMFGNEVEEVIGFLSQEKCIEDSFQPDASEKIRVPITTIPSLRYLELHVTERCNLRCRHCYIGDEKTVTLPIQLAAKAIREFGEFGFRLIITGGEPLVHPDILKILKVASRVPVRVILLTNGLLLTPNKARVISRYVHEVQISLDGMKSGHELIRGKDTFDKTVENIREARKWLDVSIATMIHSGNMNEFPSLERLVVELGAKEWTLDFLTLKGTLVNNPSLIPPADKAIKIFQNYGFGEGTHSATENLSCGSHLCSILPDGSIAKCGFIEKPVGNIRDMSLLDGWERVVKDYLPSLNDLECRDCMYLKECKGGCRYRAEIEGDFLGKDLLMCSLWHGLND
jgi:radical SAM protein with 4Fe4S-binding SPASM domain